MLKGELTSQLFYKDNGPDMDDAKLGPTSGFFMIFGYERRKSRRLRGTFAHQRVSTTQVTG